MKNDSVTGVSPRVRSGVRNYDYKNNKQSRGEDVKRDKETERRLAKKFPGWRVKFWMRGNGFELETHKDSVTEFYHLYPNIGKEAADKQFVGDVMGIIRERFPFAEFLEESEK